MRRSRLLCFTLALATLVPAVAHAAVSLPEGVPLDAVADDERHAIEDAFMEEEPLLDGKALVARPSADAFTRVQQLVFTYPGSPAVRGFLALAAERAGEYGIAAAAWTEAAKRAPAATWPLWGLADLQARRAAAEPELAALAGLEGIARDAGELERVHQRALDVLDTREVSGKDGERLRHRRALVYLHPTDPGYLARFVEELDAGHDAAPAEQRKRARAEVDAWAKAHPEHARQTTRLAAQLDLRDGKIDAAITRWRKLLVAAPLADDIEGRYADFHLVLDRTGRLADERRSLEARLAAAGASVADLVPLFYLDVAEGNLDAARARLDDASGRPARGDVEALLYARLYARLGDLVPASRLYHAVAASGATDAVREQALIELASLLVAGDLGRVGLTPLDPLDAFAADRYDTGPSLPGGVATLVFEHVRERGLGAGVSRVVAAWQNGTRAGELLDEAWKRWPRSPRVATLAATIIFHHRTWKREDAAAALADRFLAAFPAAREATDVALAGAAARRALGDRAASDRLYTRAIALAEPQGAAAVASATEAYVRVLVAEQRGPEVVALLWKRIERHPDDPAGYERLLAYVAQSKLADEELRVYERALARFPGVGYGARLARWKLKHEGEDGWRKFLEGIITSVPGADAEAYLGELLPLDWDDARSGPARFYEAFYRMALARFPYRTSFAYALLSLYERPRSANPVAAHALRLRYAALDDDLRASLVDEIARTGKLDASITQLARPRGRAERLLHADLAIWASRQEEALPDVLALRAAWPEDAALARRAASLTLATSDSPTDLKSARAAVAQYDAIAAVEPSSREWPDVAGSALAQAGDLEGARARWARLAKAHFRDPSAHLQVAAAAWDYFLFDDAVSEIQAARRLGHEPLLYWDRLGGVYESQHDQDGAAKEYVRAYVDDVGRELTTNAALWHVFDDAGGGGADYEGEEGGGYEGGEGAYVSYAHGAEAAPGDKLAALAQRPGGAKAVLAAFRAEASAAPRDFRPVYALARYQGSGAAPDAAARRATLLAALDRFSDAAFLLRVGADASSEGDLDLAVRAYERHAAAGKRSPERLFLLADAYEAAGRFEPADKTLREAARDADGFARLAGFLERRGRTDDALAARRRAAELAPPAARDERWLDLAWRYLRAGAAHAGDARTLFTDLRTRLPRDLRALDGLGALALAAKDDAALDATYSSAFAVVTKLPGVDADERRGLGIAVRQGWIAKLEQRGRNEEAMDQWIEIVNVAPDDRALVTAAADYGRRHGQQDRFVAFYTRTVARSPQDVRFPIVLAWTHEASGQAALAAADYATALLVRPDRVDLHESRAALLVTAADWPAAAAAYARLYDLSKQDERYLLPQAHALLRAGKAADATRVVELWVTRAARRGPGRFDDPARLYENLGAWASAAKLRQRGLDESLATLASGEPQIVGEDFLARLLEDGMRAGHAAATAQGLDAARVRVAKAYAASEDERQGALLGALDGALTTRLFDLVFVEAIDADAAVLLPACLAAAERAAEGTIAELAERADALGLTELTLQLLDEELDHSAKVNDWERERLELRALELLARHGGDRLLVERFDARPHAHSLGTLPTAADAARRLGDDARERRYLAEAWTLLGRSDRGAAFAERSPLVSRYLELLVAAKDDRTLTEVASRGTACATQVIDWLFAHGRLDQAMAAVEATAKVQSLPARWQSATSGLAIGEMYPTEARGHKLLQTALGRGTIAAALAAASSEAGRDASFAGKPWFRLAMTYAQRLVIAPQKGIRLSDYAFAAAEAQPLSSGAQVQAGELQLAAHDFARAQAHFELALTLQANGRAALDGIARAQLGRSDRAAALATWERIRKSGSDVDESYYVDALAKSGFVAEARAAQLAWLTKRWKDLSASAGEAGLARLAELYPANARGTGGALERALTTLARTDTRAWPTQAILGRDYEQEYGTNPDALDYRPSTNERALLADDALEPWLGVAIDAAHARHDAAAAAKSERDLCAYLARHKRWARARGFLTSLRTARATPDTPVPAWIDLALADATLHLGDVEGARQQLLARLEVTGDAAEAASAAALLAAGGQPAAAATLTVEYFERASGGRRPSRAETLRLAGAHVTLGHPERARAVLDAAIALAPDDASMPAAAADLLVAANRLADALPYRRHALTISPRDGRQRLLLARDTAQAGDRAAALATAVALLGDRDADRATRSKAAALIAAWVDADHAFAARAAQAIDRRLGATAFDAVSDVALHRARRAAGDDGGARAALERARGGKLAAVTAATYAADGEQKLAAGDASGATVAFERAVVADAGALAARVQLFRARRAAGQHVAALGALELGLDLPAYREAGGDADAARARAAAVDASARALAFLGAPVATLAADAADSAIRAGDDAAAAFFLELQARATSDTTKAARLRAAATPHLAAAGQRERANERHFAAAGEDE
jgi:hypothetical protein